MRHAILLFGVLFFSWGIVAVKLLFKGPNGEAIDFKWTGEGEGVYTVTSVGKDGLKSSESFERMRDDRATERGGDLSENGYVPGFLGSVHAYVKAQGMGLPPAGPSILPPPVVLPSSFGESRGLFVFPFLQCTKRAWDGLRGLGSLLVKSIQSTIALPHYMMRLVASTYNGLRGRKKADGLVPFESMTKLQGTPIGEYISGLEKMIQYHLRIPSLTAKNSGHSFDISLKRLRQAQLLLADNQSPEDEQWRFVFLRRRQDAGLLLHHDNPLFTYRADIAETFTKIGTTFHLMQLAEKIYIEHIGRFGLKYFPLREVSLQEREKAAEFLGERGLTPDSSLERAAQEASTMWGELAEAFSQTHASPLQAYLLYEIVFHHILEMFIKLQEMGLLTSDYYYHRLETLKFLLSILDSLKIPAFEARKAIGLSEEISHMTYKEAQKWLLKFTQAINPTERVSKIIGLTPQGEKVLPAPGYLKQRFIQQVKDKKNERIAAIKSILVEGEELSHLQWLQPDEAATSGQEITVQEEEEPEEKEAPAVIGQTSSLPPPTQPSPASIGPVEEEVPAVQKTERRKTRSNAPCLVGGKEESKASGHTTNRSVGTQHAGTILSFSYSQRIYTQLSGGNQKLLNALFGIAGYEKVEMTHLNFKHLIKEIAKHMASLGIAAKNVKQFSDEATKKIHPAHASDTGKKLPADYLDILCTTFIWWGMVPPAWQGPVNHKEAMALENYLNRATWHIWHGLMTIEDLLPCIRKEVSLKLQPRK